MPQEKLSNVNHSKPEQKNPFPFLSFKASLNTSDKAQIKNITSRTAEIPTTATQPRGVENGQKITIVALEKTSGSKQAKDKTQLPFGDKFGVNFITDQKNSTRSQIQTASPKQTGNKMDIVYDDTRVYD